MTKGAADAGSKIPLLAYDHDTDPSARRNRPIASRRKNRNIFLYSFSERW
jgi:hypothetical protein